LFFLNIKYKPIKKKNKLIGPEVFIIFSNHTKIFLIYVLKLISTAANLAVEDIVSGIIK
tara:strand:- start:299 stop:475 length:177 start_codon:yes stop_codon:yes gene_type:complete